MKLVPDDIPVQRAKGVKMKMNLKSAISVTLTGIALAFVCSDQAVGQVIVTAPSVVVSPPVAVAQVPDYYVWDGTEYVGVVGDQYYYLGPDNVWIVLDPPRRHRFDVWERDHSDWRSHETRNTRYRGGDRDRTQQMHESRPRPETRSGGSPPTTRHDVPAPSTRNPAPQPQSPRNNPPVHQNQGSQRDGNRGQANHGSGDRGGSGNQSQGNHNRNNPPQ